MFRDCHPPQTGSRITRSLTALVESEPSKQDLFMKLFFHTATNTTTNAQEHTWCACWFTLPPYPKLSICYPAFLSAQIVMNICNKLVLRMIFPYLSQNHPNIYLKRLTASGIRGENIVVHTSTANYEPWENYLVGGLEHEIYFSIYWECHHPNWRSPSFFRWVSNNHQPDMIKIPIMVNHNHHY